MVAGAAPPSAAGCPSLAALGACACACAPAVPCPDRAAPHCSQNVLPGAFWVPQLEQVMPPVAGWAAGAAAGSPAVACGAGCGGCKGAPQFSQNAVPGKFSWPHVGHAMPVLPVPPAAVLLGAGCAALTGAGSSRAPHWSQKRFPSSLT